ncbi:tubulin-like protein [Lentzea atacamensis]|uniref:Tubulin-like protein n=1 Tax=Lentzea atacamensis TaxID=531938 RepID=A0A316I1A2_9PSEU|nr:tubulin-like doman-containing protein [Lentzea atacamensis]PWK86281.1 tubulin-like protein [Lentzea atacamensis]
MAATTTGRAAHRSARPRRLPAAGRRRTALFETLRERPSAVRIPLPSEIVTKSLPCNVFVAFSVAGGTGGGVFLDFLRLIADAFALEDLHVRI